MTSRVIELSSVGSSLVDEEVRVRLEVVLVEVSVEVDDSSVEVTVEVVLAVGEVAVVPGDGVLVSVGSSDGVGSVSSSEVVGVGSLSSSVGVGSIVVVEVVGTFEVSVMVMFWRLASSTKAVAAAASSLCTASMAVLPLLQTPGWYLCGMYLFKTTFSDSSDTSASISPNLAASLCALAGRADPMETTARANSATARITWRSPRILAVEFCFLIFSVADVLTSYDFAFEGNWPCSILYSLSSRYVPASKLQICIRQPA